MRSIVCFGITSYQSNSVNVTVIKRELTRTWIIKKCKILIFPAVKVPVLL